MACRLHYSPGMTSHKPKSLIIVASVACKFVLLLGLSSWPACDSETKATLSAALTAK